MGGRRAEVEEGGSYQSLGSLVSVRETKTKHLRFKQKSRPIRGRTKRNDVFLLLFFTSSEVASTCLASRCGLSPEAA